MRTTTMVLAGALALAQARAYAQDAHGHRHEHAQSSNAVAATGADDKPPSDHVAPPPPERAMHDMSAAQMIRTMQMDDSAPYATARVDRLERAVDAPELAWNLRASYGGDLDRIVLRSEGERERGHTDGADAELLWSHAVAPFWDGLVGVRRDLDSGADRSWLALGVAGLAPYWFDIDATVYVGDGGRSALRVEAAYEMRLTQRLILEPRIEANAYGRADRTARIGAGLSDMAGGLRLRYELRREFAPYLGVERRRRFGASAGLARADGKAAAETRWLVGVRLGW